MRIGLTVPEYLRAEFETLLEERAAAVSSALLDEDGEIEIAPIAFMRGRTLANAFVILDEAQNTTAVQMKMFLTRLGENARMVVTGDLSQVDLPRGTRSGLRDAVDIIGEVDGVAVSHFDESDVVRHHLVAKIVKAYDVTDARRKSGARYESGDASQADG